MGWMGGPFKGIDLTPLRTRLCLNSGGGWAHAGQAIRFLSFRMRVVYDYKLSVLWETEPFQQLVSLRLIHKRFPL